MKKLLTINLAICDQCLVSGVNFIIAVILASCMFPDEYGLFIFATTCLVLGSGMFSSIVGVSMNILGASSSKTEWEDLFTNCFAVLILLIIGLFLIFFCLYWIMHTGKYTAIANTFPIIAFILPLTLGHDFFRNAQLSKLDIRGALYTDIATHGSRLMIIFLLSLSLKITNQIALSIYGLSAIMGIVVGCGLIRPQFTKFAHKLNRSILLKIWASSKWIFADWIPFVLYGYIYIFIVTFVLGNEQTGALGVCRNFIAPVVMLQVGISSFLLPYYRRMIINQGHDAMVTSLVKTLIGLGVVILVYLTIVNIFVDELLKSFFRHYTSFTYLVFLFTIGIFINYGFKVSEIYLLTTVQPKFIFLARILAAIPAVAICYPLVKTYGINGGGFSYIASNLFMCASMLVFMLYALRKRKYLYPQNKIDCFEKKEI